MTGRANINYRRILGLGIILGAGVIMGLIELHHIQRMSWSLGITLFALLPFLVNVGLIGAAVLLWRSSFDGAEILRIASWVLVGMVVIGLLTTWTMTYQTIHGRTVAHAPFVAVDNLSAGGLIGFAFGWFDALRRRHRREANTERTQLEFLQSSLRHNLLNGLNVIMGRVDLLDDHVDAAAHHHLDVIRRRGVELTRFTEATKALMENFLGHTADTIEPLDLSTVLDEEIENCKAEFPTAIFTTDVPDAVYIEGDELVAELFSNLLTNAVQHNDKSPPRVSVHAHRTNGSVVVRVADNGPGIPDSDKDRVLGWNIKGADSTGTGLGLAIADTVANRYGGRLWIEDNDPEGTIVNVALPITDMATANTPP